MIEKDLCLKLKQIVQEYEKQLNISDVMFRSGDKYYIDFGLNCYYIGYYNCFDGEYYRFDVEENRQVCCKLVDDVYESKQLFMEHLCGGKE